MPEPAVEETQRECYHFPVELGAVNTRAASLSSLQAMVKERANDPSVFDGNDPFIFSGCVSTSLRDSYFTSMATTSLTNFATDMEEGVALLPSHNAYRLNFGKSLAGRFIRGKGERVSRTEGEFFMLPGSTLDGIATDEVIRNIKAGVLTDLSVGFYGGRWVCDLCGEDYLRGACPHWLGMEYPPGEDGGERRLATATIHDARLSEVSVVYSGATPGAAIQKVVRAVEAGQIEPEKVRALEACYRVKLPGTRHYTPGFTPDERGAFSMANDGKGQVPEPSGADAILQAQLRVFAQAVTDAYRALGAEPPAEADTPAALRDLAGELVELRPLRAKVTDLEGQVADLTPRARDGDAYRGAKIEETWGEYVRAGLSEGVDEKEQKALWSRAPIAQVVKECEHYRKLGDARYPGGRQTSEGEPEQNGRQNGFITPPTPASAFRA